MEMVEAWNGMFSSTTLSASANSKASHMEEMEVRGSTTEELVAEAGGQPRRES